MNGSYTYRLGIAYDGTRYSGWQEQPNATSIQTLVEKALSIALHTPIQITGSGRTDAGVHALEQVAHFASSEPIDLFRLHRSLVGLLPEDIRVMRIEEAPADFHARYSAKGKIYHYHLDCGKIANPFTRLYSTHLSYPIDRDLLKRCSKHFVGTHDFTSFSNESDRGSAAKNPVRTLYRLDIVETKDTLTFEFEGNGFLYKMVRNSVGTLLDIARGKIPEADLLAIFQAKSRKAAGACAPAKGLFLVQVTY